MVDVVTLGELLIDFVPTIAGVSLLDAQGFKKAPGGAPANVAAGLVKLGCTCAFLGKVGDDAFGHFLTTTQLGAIPALPTRQIVEAFLEQEENHP